MYNIPNRCHHHISSEHLLCALFLENNRHFTAKLSVMTSSEGINSRHRVDLHHNCFPLHREVYALHSPRENNQYQTIRTPQHEMSVIHTRTRTNRAARCLSCTKPFSTRLTQIPHILSSTVLNWNVICLVGKLEVTKKW
jgi:hypothetical protein